MRLKGFEKLMGVDEALSTFQKQLKIERLASIQIPVHAALGRVMAEDFVAKTDLPPFDRSAVDGFAVMAEDTFEASQFSPKIFNITESDRIVRKETHACACAVWTGGPLPRGADAVVMLEHTKKIEDKIEVWTPVTPGENVSRKGENIQRGEVALKAGTRLQPHHLGLVAALGATHVSVVEKPKVALISTGNELVEPSYKSKPNQIVDVNRLILSGMCLELGAEPLDLGNAKDDVNEIGGKVMEGVKVADMTVTTGGTSVGCADFVPTAINQSGTPGVLVHGIAMRPGMPTALAILHGRPVLALPGNPVAAVVGFEVFARPILLRLLGIRSEPRPVIEAKTTRKVAAALGRRVFLRVYTFEKDGKFFVNPVRVKGAGVLSTLTKANGYVVIPESKEGLDKGESVKVHLFDKIGGQQDV